MPTTTAFERIEAKGTLMVVWAERRLKVSPLAVLAVQARRCEPERGRERSEEEERETTASSLFSTGTRCSAVQANAALHAPYSTSTAQSTRHRPRRAASSLPLVITPTSS